MVNYNVSVEIKAPVQKVRDIFHDFDNYTKWNDVITSVTIESSPTPNEIVLGTVVNVRFNNLKIVGTIVDNDDGKFAWEGTLLTKSAFHGHHYFKFEEIDENTTRFSHGEDFNGWLFKTIQFLQGKDKLIKPYSDFAEAVKKRAEQDN